MILCMFCLVSCPQIGFSYAKVIIKKLDFHMHVLDFHLKLTYPKKKFMSCKFLIFLISETEIC